MNLLDVEDFFDYICSQCGNYIMLEKNKDNKNILEGRCAKCGVYISKLYKDWEKWDKKKCINEDEEVK